MFIYKLILCLLAFLISGCATTQKSSELEVQGLRNQVTVLEAQLQEKDQQILQLQETFSKTTPKAQPGSSSFKHGNRPSVKQIQMALRNAGYDCGSVDGKMGKKTRLAVRSFQKINQLPVTGKADEATWAKLKENLSSKLK